jgi:hypothetical protein
MLSRQFAWGQDYSLPARNSIPVTPAYTPTPLPTVTVRSTPPVGTVALRDIKHAPDADPYLPRTLQSRSLTLKRVTSP